MIETSAFLPNIHNIDNRFTIIFREKRPNITYFNSYLIILTFSDDLNKEKGIQPYNGNYSEKIIMWPEMTKFFRAK